MIVGARRTKREEGLRGIREGVRRAVPAAEALRWRREEEEMKDKVAMAEAEMRRVRGER